MKLPSTVSVSGGIPAWRAIPSTRLFSCPTVNSMSSRKASSGMPGKASSTGQGIQQLLGPVSDVPLLSVLYTRVIVGHLDRFPCGQVQEGAAVTPLDADTRLGLVKEVANVLVQRAGHLEIVEDVGGVALYEHPQRVGVLALVDGLYPSFVEPLLPQVLYDVLLALLEPLSLVEHHPVQPPAHERHALR